MNASLETKIADALFLVLALCLPHESFARFAAGFFSSSLAEATVPRTPDSLPFQKLCSRTESRFTCFASTLHAPGSSIYSKFFHCSRNMYNGEHNSCNGGYHKYRNARYRIYNSSSHTHLHVVYSLRTLNCHNTRMLPFHHIFHINVPALNQESSTLSLKAIGRVQCRI